MLPLVNHRLSLVLLLSVTFITGCSNSNLKWYVVSPFTEQGRINLKFLITGTGDTLLMSLLALFISIVLGLLIAIPGIARNRPVRATNIVYVELIRSIPLLPLILWIYYGLPDIAGIQLDYFWAGVIALALSDSAFEAEIFRDVSTCFGYWIARVNPTGERIDRDRVSSTGDIHRSHY